MAGGMHGQRRVGAQGQSLRCVPEEKNHSEIILGGGGVSGGRTATEPCTGGADIAVKTTC